MSLTLMRQRPETGASGERELAKLDGQFDSSQIALLLVLLG